jgi:transposase InsO family protein
MFILENQKEFSIQRMCSMLGVKPETYYAWIRRPPSKRSQDNTEMLKKIKAIHKESKELYGSPKIYQMLKAQNVDCSENRVAKLMRKNSIKAKIRKKFRAKSKVIKSSHASENLLKREFQVLRINTVWVTDITYIPTRLGWMYLCVFIDLFSRKIVGWSMANHMRTEMVIAALIMAYQNRKPGKGLIIHSDQGSQYGSDEFRKELKKMGMIQSMSGRGNCWDNACAESFFHLLKTELIQFMNYQNYMDAKISIFEYLEVFYNRYRIHSTLGYQSPVSYEFKKSLSLCA